MEDEKEYQDSITFGSAAKGVALKAYIDFTDVSDGSDTDKKIKNMLKVEQYFKEVGKL